MKKNGEIMSLALPAIATNITTPILGLVDVAISGHIGEASYIAAIAVGGAMFNMLYWLFNFLRMGTTGITAQAYGKNPAAAAEVLYRSLMVAAVIGLLIFVFGYPLGRILIRFVDSGDCSPELAWRYFYIGLAGAPAVMCTYSLAGWFIGMQNTRATLLMALTTNLTNIAISCTLVFGFHLKIEGVAAGTVCGQWLGLIAGASVVMSHYRPRFPGIKTLIRRAELLRFFRLNSDIFMRTLCLVTVTLWFTRAGAARGVDILAGNAVLLQLFMLCSFFLDGFGFAAEALAGKYLGAGDTEAVRRLARRMLRIGFGIAIVIAAVYAAGGELFVNMLTDDASVRRVAVHYLPWAILIPLCGFSGFIFDGIFVGLTRTGGMLIAMASAAAVFFAVYLSLNRSLANHGLWLAFNSYLLCRGAVEALIFFRAYGSHTKKIA